MTNLDAREEAAAMPAASRSGHLLENSFDLAAEVGFYLLFSLFPFLLFLMTLLRQLPLPVDGARLLAVSQDVLPDHIYALIIPLAVKALAAATGRLAFPALILSLWTASAAVSSLLNAIGRSGRLSGRNPYWREKALSLLLTAVFGGLLLVALLLLFLGPLIQRLLAEWFGYAMLWRVGVFAARWSVVIVLMLATVSILYHCAPGARSKHRILSAGAWFAAIGWIISSKVFGFYLNFFGKMDIFYGGVGALLSLMTWLYLMALIVLLGARIDNAIDQRTL
ncbi:MAG TPA: hypothetical protein DEB40_09015 [Elusimicrobia bacterium]|nr:hypothetical protein [Elusimicrobiota bacterium]HBT61868.1 hypothetical protein [Elusimicrobiota bacterium]